LPRILELRSEVMDIKQTIKWLEDLLAQQLPVKKGGIDADYIDPLSEATKWIASAESAISAAFPPGHAIRRLLESVLAQSKGPKPYMIGYASTWKSARGVLESALEQVKAGYLSSLADGIKAETVGELLDQAAELADGGHVLPAMTLAGGALETFLHHLCEKHGRTWTDPGSIEKYKATLVAKDAADAVILEKDDNKAVTRWGGLRNTASHKPVEFKESGQQVKLTIQEIRLFIKRHS
jgi:hypothetical protein